MVGCGSLPPSPSSSSLPAIFRSSSSIISSSSDRTRDPPQLNTSILTSYQDVKPQDVRCTWAEVMQKLHRAEQLSHCLYTDLELHAHPHPRHRVDTLKHITIPFYDEFKQHDINVPIYATMRDIIPAVSQVIGDANNINFVCLRSKSSDTPYYTQLTAASSAELSLSCLRAVSIDKRLPIYRIYDIPTNEKIRCDTAILVLCKMLPIIVKRDDEEFLKFKMMVDIEMSVAELRRRIISHFTSKYQHVNVTFDLHAIKIIPSMMEGQNIEAENDKYLDPTHTDENANLAQAQLWHDRSELNVIITRMTKKIKQEQFRFPIHVLDGINLSTTMIPCQVTAQTTCQQLKNMILAKSGHARTRPASSIDICLTDAKDNIIIMKDDDMLSKYDIPTTYDEADAVIQVNDNPFPTRVADIMFTCPTALASVATFLSFPTNLSSTASRLATEGFLFNLRHLIASVTVHLTHKMMYPITSRARGSQQRVIHDEEENQEMSSQRVPQRHMMNREQDDFLDEDGEVELVQPVARGRMGVNRQRDINIVDLSLSD